MPMNLIGKVLFPGQPEWQARRQAKQMVAAFTVAIILGCVVAAIIWFSNAKH